MPNVFFTGKICLALSGIPMMLALLQYLSMYKEIGELVIMLMSMVGFVSYEFQFMFDCFDF